VSQEPTGEVRPSASTTSSARISRPSRVRTPRTRTRPSVRSLSASSPAMRVDVASTTLPSASTARRSAYSNSGRRAQIETNLSSPSRASAGRSSYCRFSRAPSARTWLRTSGARSSRTWRPSARKLCGWRTCAIPGRSQHSNSRSASPVTPGPSRSSRSTRRPLRAKASDADRPASPAPSTTTSLRSLTTCRIISASPAKGKAAASQYLPLTCSSVLSA
jgi:hypothetical protein